MANYKGKGTIQITGRQTGKSYLHQAFMKMFEDDEVFDLKLSTGKVFGCRFYTVEPVGGRWSQMEEWCTRTFGPVSDAWHIKENNYQVGRWYVNDRRFWFRNEQDQMMFVMKWR